MQTGNCFSYYGPREASRSLNPKTILDTYKVLLFIKGNKGPVIRAGQPERRCKRYAAQG